MLKQVVQLLSGVSLSKFLQFLYFFSAATYCSKEEFGSYVFVLTLNLVFIYPVLEWGTELLINQHTAQENPQFFSTALCLETPGLSLTVYLPFDLCRILFEFRLETCGTRHSADFHSKP